jgi:hypothetical protein
MTMTKLTLDERAAKARLEAAASDMLEALQSAKGAVKEICFGQDPANQCWFVLEEIRAAIAKATGKGEG